MLVIAQTYYDAIELSDGDATLFADDNPTQREIDFEPFDLPAMHVFRIRGGKIREIEAMGFMTPYMSPSGWNPHLK